MNFSENSARLFITDFQEEVSIMSVPENKGNAPEKVCPRNAYAAFFHALCADDTNAVIRAASELYECPVLLTDEHYRLLYQYPEHRLGQSIWDSLHDTGVLPLDTIWEYQQAFLSDTPSIYEPFYADWGPAAEVPRIFGEVYTPTGRILGHFAIFKMDRPLGPYDLEVAGILAQALEIRLSQRHSRDASSAGCLIDLLSDESSPQSRLFASSVLSKRLKSGFCVMCTPVGKSAAGRAFAASAVDRLCLTFRNTVSAVYGDCIVTLFGEMSGRIQTDRERGFLTRAAETLKTSYPVSGISACFSALSDIGKYYRQAYYTALLEQKGTIFYTDEAPRPLFMQLAGSDAADAYIHPALPEIFLYDQKHNTQYFMTLHAYSLSMHNKDAAADTLRIHRNTLMYRLNRIEELFSLPYEDERTALHLLNSFQIWDILNRTGQPHSV